MCRTWDYEFRRHFKFLDEATIQTEKCLPEALRILDVLSSEQEGGQLRRVARSLFHEADRKKDESLTQHVARRQRQYAVAEAMDIKLQPKLQGYLLEEGSGLPIAGIQTLRALTGGDIEIEAVARGLRSMDTTTSEKVLHRGAGNHWTETPDSDARTTQWGPDGTFLDDSGDSEDDGDEDEAAVLDEVQDLCLFRG